MNSSTALLIALAVVTSSSVAAAQTPAASAPTQIQGFTGKPLKAGLSPIAQCANNILARSGHFPGAVVFRAGKTGDASNRIVDVAIAFDAHTVTGLPRAEPHTSSGPAFYAGLGERGLSVASGNTGGTSYGEPVSPRATIGLIGVGPQGPEVVGGLRERVVGFLGQVKAECGHLSNQ